MQQSDKKVDYNTKISEEDFELLQKQREARNQNQLNMIQSKYIGGGLSGLQSRLRISMNADESTALKEDYKNRDAVTSGSSLDENFQTRGIDKMQNIGYSNDN